MTSKKKMYEAAEYYRLQWKQCITDCTAATNAAHDRIVHLEQIVDSQKEHIVNAERMLRELEDSVYDAEAAVTFLIHALESEAEVAEDTAKAMRAKIEKAREIAGNRVASNTVPDSPAS